MTGKQREMRRRERKEKQENRSGHIIQSKKSQVNKLRHNSSIHSCTEVRALILTSKFVLYSGQSHVTEVHSRHLNIIISIKCTVGVFVTF